MRPKHYFLIGDIARLCSGGPPMTVKAVSRAGDHFLLLYVDSAGVIRQTPTWVPVEALCSHSEE